MRAAFIAFSEVQGPSSRLEPAFAFPLFGMHALQKYVSGQSSSEAKPMHCACCQVSQSSHWIIRLEFAGSHIKYIVRLCGDNLAECARGTHVQSRICNASLIPARPPDHGLPSHQAGPASLHRWYTSFELLSEKHSRGDGTPFQRSVA